MNITYAYLFTEEVLVDNIYESFINNTCKPKFLLKGLKCYQDTQMKACNVTQATCYAVVCDFTLVCHCTIFELIQTVQVPALLDGAKILRKRSTVWVGRTNVTDDRQTIDIRTARAIRASGRFLWPILYLVNRPATVDFYCAMSRPMHSADYDVATCLSVCPSDTRLYCVETA